MLHTRAEHFRRIDHGRTRSRYWDTATAKYGARMATAEEVREFMRGIWPDRFDRPGRLSMSVE